MPTEGLERLHVNVVNTSEFPGGSGSPSQVEGTTAGGGAFSDNPVVGGGVDGAGDAQSFLTDTAGRQIVIGAAADGTAAVDNPLLVAGADSGGVTRALFTDTSSRLQVVGAAADGASPDGNPLLIAGQDGVIVQSILTDSSGRQETLPRMAGGVADGAQNPGTIQDTGGNSRPLSVAMYAYNGGVAGVSSDRWRANIEQSVLASAARTGTPSVSEITTYNARGCLIIVEVTAITATPEVTPSLQVRVPASSSYATIWTGGTITGTGIYTYLIYPGASDAGAFTETIAAGIARRIRPQFAHADADSITYSVDIILLV